MGLRRAVRYKDNASVPRCCTDPPVSAARSRRLLCDTDVISLTLSHRRVALRPRQVSHAWRPFPSLSSSIMTREAELIRACVEDLALEILTSYTDEDFEDADFSSLGNAAVYLQERQTRGPDQQMR